jgi:acid stress chaperone HdeB
MKTRTIILLSALFLTGGQVSMDMQAQATVIDLSTMKCKEFLEGSKEDIGYTLAWLDAYYKGEDDPPVIDTDKFVANSKKLADYCVANPTLGLITATDKLFGQ